MCSSDLVRLVQNQADMTRELQTGHYDVIIAPYSEKGAVEDSAGEVLEKTAFLPVAMTADEEKQAKRDYTRVLVADRDKLKHYLKAIHKTIKLKT